MDREALGAQPAHVGRFTRLPGRERDASNYGRSGAAPRNYLFQSWCLGLALPAVRPLVSSAAQYDHARQQWNRHARRGCRRIGNRSASNFYLPRSADLGKTSACGYRRGSRGSNDLHSLSQRSARFRQGIGADHTIARLFWDTTLLGAIGLKREGGALPHLDGYGVL